MSTKNRDADLQRAIETIRNPAPGVHLVSSGFKETPAPADYGVFGVMEHQHQMVREKRAYDIVEEIFSLILFVTDENATIQKVRNSKKRLVELIAPLIKA